MMLSNYFYLLSQGQACLSNPYGEPPQTLMVIQAQVADLLFVRNSYVKKLIEDCNNSEDTAKLLRVGDHVIIF